MDIVGTDGNDSIKGLGGDDTIYGKLGSDTLYGNDGNDDLWGNFPPQDLSGKDGSNILYGGKGNDTLSGDNGDDKLCGEDGNDDLNGGNGNDQIDGGKGDDFIIALGGSDTVYGGDGNDSINDNSEGLPNPDDKFYGGKGNDILDGGDGKNKLYGEADNDTLRGGKNDEILDGGTGFDLADYSFFGSSFGVTVNLTKGTASGTSGNDTLISIENIRGSVGKDTLIGNAGDNVLYGDPEPDGFPPSGGNDKLIGGFGKDTLTGGKGSDTFIFNSPKEGIDQITDFSSSPDTIQVVANGFGGGLQPGTITTNQFVLGATAKDTFDRFIYNQSIGALYFDPDGKGGTAQIQFATLANKALLTSSDIVVI